LLGNTSGCGSHYLLQQCYISRCISGRKVSGQSTETPIRGSDTKRDELHWECFCKQLSLARVVNRAYRFSIISYPLAYSVVVLPISLATDQAPCTIGDYVFCCHAVLPLRCHQCPPVPHHQTGTPPPPSRATPRARNAAGTSRY
jgi:hypothetical protein